MLFRELLHSVTSSLSKTREEIVVDTFVIQVDIYVYIIYANLKWISIEQLVSTKQLHVHSTCILRETTQWSLKETSYFNRSLPAVAYIIYVPWVWLLDPSNRVYSV